MYLDKLARPRQVVSDRAVDLGPHPVVDLVNKPPYLRHLARVRLVLQHLHPHLVLSSQQRLLLVPPDPKRHPLARQPQWAAVNPLWAVVVAGALET